MPQLSSCQPGLLFCGLRARGAVAWGELKGDAMAGAMSGMVVYRGRAWAAAEKLASKAKAGEVRRGAGRRRARQRGPGRDVWPAGGRARMQLQLLTLCPGV